MAPFQPNRLPPKVDWDPLIPLLGPAHQALATFSGVLYGLPNAEVLLSPLTTQEAVLSSRIEGTQATLGEVLKFEAGEAPDQEAKQVDILEILNYRRALKRARDELPRRPFNLNLLLEMHGILLDSVRGRDKGRGTFRKTQNWIGAPGCKIEEASFVPPPPGLLPDFLDDFEKFYHAEFPDILVQLAIVHGQFEILHPFLDGNGRIGRILIPIFLFERRLLSWPVFYLSSFIEKNKDEYIDCLRSLDYSPAGWNKWIGFFLRATTIQAEENMSTARRIMELYERLKKQVIGLTHSQYAVPLLDRLFDRPIISPKTFDQNSELPSKQTIMTLLNKLKDAGILTVFREASGRRPQILLFPELLNICEGRNVV